MTPDYASPEQVMGQLITTATDTYLLGTLLYEMLSGQPAHKFQNYSTSEIQRVVCQEDPVPPSEAARLAGPPATEVNSPRLLQGDLDAIVAMTMRKEPERRYHSVQQLAEDVERVLGRTA